MNLKKTKIFFILLIFFFTFPLPSYAFPPQSVEFLPGYKFPDSASNGAPSFDLRYFLHFPSVYLAAGVGIGHISAQANNQNLAIGSDLQMTPIGFTLRFLPPMTGSFDAFVEVGVDHLSQFRYKFDPSVDSGQNNSCTTDISVGPLPCHIATIEKRSVAYRFGAGIEKVFRSGFGVGLHYTYRLTTPVRQTVSDTPSFGVQPPTVTNKDLFNFNQSILSLLVSYHF